MAGEVITRASMDALAQDEYARKRKPKRRKRKRPSKEGRVSVIRRAMGAG